MKKMTYQGVAVIDGGAIRFDSIQSLTDLQKQQARENLGIPSNMVIQGGGGNGSTLHMQTYDITLFGTETNYKMEVDKNGVLAIGSPFQARSNNLSLVNGERIECGSEGLFGSKGYAWAVAKAGGIVKDKDGNIVTPGDSDYNIKNAPWFVTTGQVKGLNNFAACGGSTLGNHLVAIGRGCFITVGKDEIDTIDPSKKFGLVIGYECVADTRDVALIGVRNYALGYRGAYGLGSSIYFYDAGSGQVTTGSTGIGIGYKLEIAADSVINVGITNKGLHKHTYLFGREIITKAENQLLFGFNPSVSADTLFAIGDGKLGGASSNIIHVTKNSDGKAGMMEINCPLKKLWIGTGCSDANNVSLFLIGDGTDSAKHNLFEIRKNRSAYLNEASFGVGTGLSFAGTYKNSMLVGSNLTANSENQLVVGKGNGHPAPNNLGATLFAVNYNKNLFRIQEKGAQLNVPLVIDRNAKLVMEPDYSITEARQLVTKEYVDNKLGGTLGEVRELYQVIIRGNQGLVKIDHGDPVPTAERLGCSYYCKTVTILPRDGMLDTMVTIYYEDGSFEPLCNITKETTFTITRPTIIEFDAH